MQDILISAGNSNFHLLFSAAELDKRGRLNKVLCGPYPTKAVLSLLQFFGLKKRGNVPRLINRREAIRDEAICSYWSGEVLSKISSNNALPFSNSIRDRLNVFVFHCYGQWACKQVQKAAASGVRIYHYRAGYGGKSVEIAKKAGMVTLCDHSIAHPAVLLYLMDNNGKYPVELPDIKGDWKRTWMAILDDIKPADYVLVNSDFVKQTFEFDDAFNPKKIAVIYQGIEDKFLEHLPPNRSFRQPKTDRPLRLLFAGYFGRRKGAENLITAFLQLAPDLNITLRIAGTIEPIFKTMHPEFWQHPKVTYLGVLSQQELAQEMLNSDVFVFPSLAEGSARVIFEALATGCFVITTPNSGSIVKHGVHGYLVEPGSIPEIVQAIQATIDNPEAIETARNVNWNLMRSEYRQHNYGDQLVALYSSILGE